LYGALANWINLAAIWFRRWWRVALSVICPSSLTTVQADDTWLVCRDI